MAGPRVTERAENPYSPRRIVENLARRGIALGLVDGELVPTPSAAMLPSDLVCLVLNRASVRQFLRRRSPSLDPARGEP
jgi:hypothetical protein